MMRLVLRLVGRRGPFPRWHPGHDVPYWVSDSPRIIREGES